MIINLYLYNKPDRFTTTKYVYDEEHDHEAAEIH